MAYLTLRRVSGAVANFRTYYSESKLRNGRALQVYAKIQEAQALPTDRDFLQDNARTRDARWSDAHAAVIFPP